MKKKKLRKIFALNKETIAHLNRDEMKAVGGGEDTCGYSCPCAPTKETIMPTKESQGGTC
ncbi:MAG: class I lanthipeptide [Candidatus Aminicenantes bacterium]|nr:MAG: class I lanthipeptide [Candidatus Aminicenantes bacterium]